MVGVANTLGIVLGTPFLRQYYTYFDYTNSSVSFAPA